MTKNCVDEFQEVNDHFRQDGFYKVAHAVALHHLRKDFVDYDVIRDRFFIKPVGKDFLHIAVVEHEYGCDNTAIQIRYTCAGDDLLYGLQPKFNSGGSTDYEEDLTTVNDLVDSGNLRTHPRYVRKRFRHGRTKAKLRALIVMFKEKWSSIFSFA